MPSTPKWSFSCTILDTVDFSLTIPFSAQKLSKSKNPGTF